MSSEEEKQSRKKTGGRKAGTPNKITREIRDVLKEASTDYFNSQQFKIDLMMLDPKDRLAMQEKLLRYTLPTLSAVDANLSIEQRKRQKLEEMNDDNLLKLIDTVLENN